MGRRVIEALDPQAIEAIAAEPSLQPVAAEAARRLRAALASLEHVGRAG